MLFVKSVQKQSVKITICSSKSHYVLDYFLDGSSYQDFVTKLAVSPLYAKLQ